LNWLLGPQPKSLLEDHVLERTLGVDHRHALADPRLVHQLGLVGPDLEVVRPHEVASDAVSKDRVDELPEIGGLGNPVSPN